MLTSSLNTTSIRRAGVAFALLLTCLCGNVASADARPRAKDRCARHVSHTVRLNREVRVFSRAGSTYACLRKTGRTTLLFDSDGEYTGGSVLSVVGRWVAYSSYETPTCKAACPPGVEGRDQVLVADAATGKERALGDATWVYVNPNGGVVWLVGESPSSVLYAWDAYGPREIDRGGISSSSLHVDGLVYWLNGSAPRSWVFP